MAEKEIGRVTHWYDKIGVAVIKLAGALKVGDRIKVKHGAEEFTDTVNSMQIEHQDVAAGKKNDEIAIKLSQKAKDGATVHLAE